MYGAGRLTSSLRLMTSPTFRRVATKFGGIVRPLGSCQAVTNDGHIVDLLLVEQRSRRIVEHRVD